MNASGVTVFGSSSRGIRSQSGSSPSSKGRSQRAPRHPILRTLLAAALLAAAPVSAPVLAYTPELEPRAPQDPPARAMDDTIPLGPAQDIPLMEDGAPYEEPYGEDEAIAMPPPRAGLDDVRYGDGDLPDAVSRARAALIKAAKTGEVEALRPLFEAQRVAPIVAPFGDVDDAVDHLKRQSGDDAGREILAILIELLEGGYVSVGEGSTETFVWPYFAEVPLASLSPAQMVEVYRILTSIDVEEVERLGRYTFFRVGIAPDGRVRYFSAGDVE